MKRRRAALLALAAAIAAGCNELGADLFPHTDAAPVDAWVF